MLDAVERVKLPLWFRVVAGLGAAWNVFGIVQFFGAVAPTAESLAAKGMTPSQAAVYMSIPLWMNVAFAIGTFGGLAGSVLMLGRRNGAKPVFAVSLAGYVALYIGDITHGVFAALGAPQVVVLTSVVAIAMALLWVAGFSQKRHYLS